jgi:Fe-S cluster assembly protein SufD
MTATAVAGAVVPAADLAPRLASGDPADFAVPTGREEQWRFTPLERLRGLHDGSATATAHLAIETDVPPGVTAELVGPGDPRLGSVQLPTDRVAAQAFESMDQALVVTVPPGLEAAGAAVIRLRGTGGTAFGHVLVDVGAGATAVVVLDHVGTATFAGGVEAAVGDGATLTLVSVQDWERDAVHAGHIHGRVGRDATFRGVVVTLGGDLVRLVPSVSYAGPGGKAELLGVFFADQGQHQEHRVFVDHDQPHCRSDVVYRGALQGAGAHTVWIGDVLVRKAAVGTDTYEINRNLLLGPGARADSVPNLELETGEVVGAGHASTTGRFDDEQLFYLQSRGIPAAEARRLVVRGFFADVFARIGVPDLEQRLLRAVDAELGAVPQADDPDSLAPHEATVEVAETGS